MWLWGIGLGDPMHPSCPHPIQTSPHATRLLWPLCWLLPAPSGPQPTLQLGMRQKHLRALLKHGLFLEELGSEGFEFFCLWNTVYLEQKDREWLWAA